MSKKSLFCSLVAILVMGAMVHLGMSLQQNNAERDLFRANVEALTDGEATEVQWCYIEADMMDVERDSCIFAHELFCRDSTDNSHIYPCEEERFAYYERGAQRDRCVDE